MPIYFATFYRPDGSRFRVYFLTWKRARAIIPQIRLVPFIYGIEVRSMLTLRNVHTYFKYSL